MEPAAEVPLVAEVQVAAEVQEQEVPEGHQAVKLSISPG